MRPAVALATLAVVLLAAAPGARAQLDPVRWSAAAEPAVAEPGGLVMVTLRAEIGAGWRLYAMDSGVGRPLKLRFEDAAGLSPIGPAEQEQPRAGFDETLEQDYTYFSEAVTLSRAYRVAEAAEAGPATVNGGVTYMVCNDDVCLPPKTEPFFASVRIEAAEKAAAPPPAVERPASPPMAVEPDPVAEAAPPEPAEQEPAEASVPDDTLALAEPEPVEAEPSIAAPVDPLPEAPERGGLWGFLLLAVGAGFIALLTPCVFPMIPLTVSYFLHHTGDRRQAARMAGLYGLSIIGLFTGLGVLMAALVGAAGPQLIAANPWVNLFIGAVLIVFGFSLLGFYEIRTPAVLSNYTDRRGRERGGVLGVVFMGLTLVLVSFSCTVPFVGGLMAQAVRSEWVYPVIGMVAFSTVFALPFVLFALFPTALTRLPKSGPWMTALKGMLGFVEIAAALKFLSNADLVWGLGVLPRPLAIALMTTIFALMGFFLLGKLRLRTPETEAGLDAAPAPVGPLRLATAIAAFGLALYLVPGLLGAPLGGIDAYLPPRQATDVSLLAAVGASGEAGKEEGWYQSREVAFAEAARTGRPVLIDFTGYTCTNCRYMEANVLSRPAVARRIEGGFVPLQLWTDDGEEGPALQRYQLELIGSLALPTYAVVSPEGGLRGHISGITSVEEFAAFLDRHTPAAALAQR